MTNRTPTIQRYTEQIEVIAPLGHATVFTVEAKYRPGYVAAGSHVVPPDGWALKITVANLGLSDPQRLEASVDSDGKMWVGSANTSPWHLLALTSILSLPNLFAPEHGLRAALLPFVQKTRPAVQAVPVPA